MTAKSVIVSLCLVAGTAVSGSGPAAAKDASAWVDGFHSRVRLVSGGQENGYLLAGVEIVLDRGFKTYWRSPGDSGLPPRFDWSASTNLRNAVVQWPMPTRSEEAGITIFGYADRLVLPVVIAPQDPARPVRLVLTVDYGVCKDICIPAHATLALDLDPRDRNRAVVDEARARVPRPQALGADSPLSVLAVEPARDGTAGLAVTVRAPAGATLFAEGPEDWSLSTAGGEPAGPGRARFRVVVEERPNGAAGPVPIRLTLAADGQAVETEVRLDAGQWLR